MSHEWSRVVSAEVKEEYMTLQGRLQDYSLPHCSKVKSHLNSVELDINASQACLQLQARKLQYSKKTKN